jgi:hypothetical protein
MNYGCTIQFRMSEINSTMPKKASRKKTEAADPYIQPIESEDKQGLSKEPPQDHPCSDANG